MGKSATPWQHPASRVNPLPPGDPPGGIRAAGLANLAAGLAHDIRNPLTSIKTFTSVLRVRKDQLGFMERFERSVSQGIERIEALLNDLAYLAGPAKPGGPDGEVLDSVILPDLLSDCLAELDEELALRGIARSLSTEEGLTPVQGNAARLRRAFMSLLRFSSQAAGTGRTLTVRAEHGAAGALVTCIVNDGPGLAAEQLPHFFEPYFPLARGQGAGLALALARKIVSEHGGRIEIDSRPGQGTTIRVILPVMP